MIELSFSTVIFLYSYMGEDEREVWQEIFGNNDLEFLNGLLSSDDIRRHWRAIYLLEHRPEQFEREFEIDWQICARETFYYLFGYETLKLGCRKF